MARSPLAILSSAALSLPAFAATQPTETTISIKTSHYEESDLPGRDVILGSTDRYDIDVHQFQLTTPVKGNWSLGIEASKEIMSGASPWGTATDADGNPTLIMSGATIKDRRTAVSLSATHYGDKRSTSVTLSKSDEDDYTAEAITIGSEWTLMDGMGTLAIGASYSSDDIEPSEAALFGRVTHEEKSSRSLSVAWTHILNQSSLMQVGTSITKQEGYLTDPYKLIDKRPDDRLEKTLSVRYRKYIEPTRSALHVDYRYYRDDFGVRSHTLEGKWHQQITDYLQVVPGVRYYSQKEADFYSLSPVFSGGGIPIQSSDFRLSSYGAYAFSIKAVVNLDAWVVDLAFERYISDGDYGLDDPATPHPALLEFDLVTLGLSYRF